MPQGVPDEIPECVDADLDDVAARAVRREQPGRSAVDDPVLLDPVTHEVEQQRPRAAGRTPGSRPPSVSAPAGMGIIRLTYHATTAIFHEDTGMVQLWLEPRTDLRNPIFHDDDAAREHLEAVLWPQGPVCPRCGVMGDRITKLAGKSTRPGVYNCKDCRKPFYRHGRHRHGALAYPAVEMGFGGAPDGREQERLFGASNCTACWTSATKAAWFLFHRLREAANDIDDTGPLGGANKVVEADETYIGGKEANKHAWKRQGVGGGPGGKMPVVSLVERDGAPRAFTSPTSRPRTCARSSSSTPIPSRT